MPEMAVTAATIQQGNGDQHHNRDALRRAAVAQRRAEEVENDAQHLQHGLYLAPHVGGDDLAVLGTGGHHAQAGHCKLAGQDDAQHHRAAHAVPHHVDKGHGGQQLVGQRVGKLAKIGDHVPLACQMAVQIIGKAGNGKHDACQQVERCIKGAVHDVIQAGEGCKDHEHRHQDDAGQGEFIGQIHTNYPPIRYFTTVPYRS